MVSQLGHLRRKRVKKAILIAGATLRLTEGTVAFVPSGGLVAKEGCIGVGMVGKLQVHSS
jgi:hypothetical protein